MKDEDIQNWLRKIGQENAGTLSTALTGAGEDVLNCVYRNMSPRAGAILKMDVEKKKTMASPEWEIMDSMKELERIAAQL